MGLKVIINEKINGIPGEYGKDFMKIKFNAGHNLSLNKILKIYNITIVFRCFLRRQQVLSSRFFRRMFVWIMNVKVW